MIPLTDTEKTDARRFCGYPAYGYGTSGFQSWRFFQVYGLMEFRLNNLSLTELAVMRTYLAQCNTLETALWTASASADTAKAGIWTHNADEIKDRVKLLNIARRKICGFIGVPAGPDLGDGGLQIIV